MGLICDVGSARMHAEGIVLQHVNLFRGTCHQHRRTVSTYNTQSLEAAASS